MTPFDVILLFVVFGFAWYGFLYGLVRTVGGLLGLVLGFYVAGILAEPIAPWLGFLVGGREEIAKVIVFIVIFIILNRFTGFVFFLLDRIFKFVSFIPFLKSINRLAGLLLGLIEGVLVVGGVLLFTRRFIIDTPLADIFLGSDAAYWLVKIAGILLPLLPNVLADLPTVFSQVVDKVNDVVGQ